MPIGSFSDDVWTYLNDMPYLPNRADRDALANVAQYDPATVKRVQIWDYFFRIRPDDVGKPQMQEIEQLRQRSQQTRAEHETQIQAERKTAEQRKKKLAAPILKWQPRFLIVNGLGAALLVAAFLLKSSTVQLAGAVLVTLGAGAFIGAGLWRRRQFTRIGKHLENTIERLNANLHAALEQSAQDTRQLRKTIRDLQAQIPPPPSDDQVLAFLRADLDALAQAALDKTGLRDQLFDLGGAANPICFFAPAELQNNACIPKPFLEPASDLNKHLHARVFAYLPDGAWLNLHGVYYVEILILGLDWVANYECYYDFVTGRRFDEHMSEQHYADIVTLSTSRAYRELPIGAKRIIVDDALTFGMSLASTEKIEITFPSRGYFAGMNNAGFSAFYFDLERWALNPAPLVENTLIVLREQWRKHKGILGV